MSEYEHFLCEFRFNAKSYFVIWYDGSEDGLLVDSKQKLAQFEHQEDARNFLIKQGFYLSENQVTIYNFDRIAQWVNQPTPAQIDCVEFLDVWNMFVDVANSVGGSSVFMEKNSDLDSIYQKLFYGCNLLSITPPGEQFEPTWTLSEMTFLSNLFGAGIELLRIALH
jgi:hypothetical protein